MQYNETFRNYISTILRTYFTYSVSLVNLFGRDVSTSHGDGETIISKLSRSRDVLASILPLLPGHEAVALHGDGGGALPPVRGRLLKLLTQPGQSSVSKSQQTQCSVPSCPT